MIKPFCDIGPKKSLQFDSDSDDDDVMCDFDDDVSVDDNISVADKVADNCQGAVICY